MQKLHKKEVIVFFLVTFMFSTIVSQNIVIKLKVCIVLSGYNSNSFGENSWQNMKFCFDFSI